MSVMKKSKKLLCIILSCMLLGTALIPNAFASENIKHRYSGLYEINSATVIWKGIESKADFDDVTGTMKVVSTDVETGEVLSVYIYKIK